MKKRIICVLLALIMVVGVLPAAALTASAASLTTSDAAIKVLKDFEGYSKTCYWDYSQYSIGYGTACEGDHTEEGAKHEMYQTDADAALRKEVASIEEAVSSFASSNGLSLNQNKFDALVLFSYNCGTAWMKGNGIFKNAVVNGATGNDFLQAISLWSNVSGENGLEVNSTLLNRRLAEANMYLNGGYDDEAPSNYTYVKYDGNSGEASMRVQGYNTNSAVAPKATASLDGKTFMGWYTANGAWVYSLDKTVAGKTLVAHWQDVKNPEYSSVSYKLPMTSFTALQPVSEPSSKGTAYGSPYTAKDTVEIIEDYLDANGNRWCHVKGGGWLKVGTMKVETEESGVVTNLVVNVTNSYINVRNGPDTTYTKVGTVYSGNQLTITEVTTASNGTKWGKFSKGWVALMYTDYDAVIQQAGGSAEDGDVVATAVVVCSSTVNLRNAAGMSGTIVGSLSNGTKVNLYAIKAVNGHDWGKTSDGWFCLDYATVTKLTEGTDTAPEGTVDPDVIATGTVVGCTNLNVRKKAGVGEALVTTIACGSSVSIYETTTVNGHEWGRISSGWICLDYVNVNKVSAPESGTEENTETAYFAAKITSAAAVYKAAGQNKTDTVLAEGKKVNVYELTSVTSKDVVTGSDSDTNVTITQTVTTYWAHIDEGWVETKYIELDAIEQEYKVISNTLNVRPVAGTSQDPINKLSNGSVVEITDLEIVGTSVWGKTEAYSGWVNIGSAYMEIYTAPVAAPEDPEGTGTAAVKTGTVVCSTTVNVRQKAGVTEALVTTLANGTKINVYDTTTVNGHDWGKIDQGWICMDYVRLDATTSNGANVSGNTNSSSGTAASGSYLATGVVTGGVQLNVRSGAGLSYGSVATLNSGDEFTVYERVLADGMSWGRIDKGWICLSYTLITGTSKTGSGVMGTIGNTYTGANVRSSAGTGNALLCKILTGSRVEVYQQTLYSGSYWGLTSMGWVCMDYVVLDTQLPEGTDIESMLGTGTGSDSTSGTVTESTAVTYTGIVTSNVDVYKTAGGTSVATALSANTAVTVHELTSVVVSTTETDPNDETVTTKIDQTYYWARIDEGWILAEKVKLDAVEATYTVISETLNVRENAGTSYGKIGKLAKGDVVVVTELAIVNASVWGYIEDEGGWANISATYMTPGKVNVSTGTENSTATDANTTTNSTNPGTTTNPSTGTATGSALYTGTIIGTDKVNVRTSPSTAENTMAGSLKKGTSVTIYELAVAEYMAWGRTDSGWVSLVYVDLVPVDSNAIDARVVQIEGTNIRASASATAESVGTYAKNTVINIYEFSGNWARTDAGWVHTDNLLY